MRARSGIDVAGDARYDCFPWNRLSSIVSGTASGAFVSDSIGTFGPGAASGKDLVVDLNLVVLAGRLAAPPEVRQFESGSVLARYLLTVHSEEPRRRVDVVPITLWDPPDSLLDDDPVPGAPLWISGSIQRRFWSAADGRRSRLEVVASEVCPRPVEEA